MTNHSFQTLRETVLDRRSSRSKRLSAMASLAEQPSRESVEVLLQVGEREDEPEWVLQGAGRALARLLETGADVTEWDVRNLRKGAADGFFNA